MQSSSPQSFHVSTPQVKQLQIGKTITTKLFGVLQQKKTSANENYFYQRSLALNRGSEDPKSAHKEGLGGPWM